MHMQRKAVCTKVPKLFFLNVAFISNISLFCILQYARPQQDKLGGIKIFVVAPI